MSRPHVATPSELGALRDLELVARTTVEGMRQGLHRSPFHGFSAEFSQYRHYRAGDDLKHVDWKAFARTDRLYTRQFRETTNLSALFVVDMSRSMDYPPRPAQPAARGTILTKLGLAQAVAATLGTLILDQGDAAGLLAVAERVSYVPARSGHHHLRVYLAQLAALMASGAAPFAASLRRAATLLKRRGLVIALSDFYDDGEAMGEVRRLKRMGHEVIAIHTLAADELVLPASAAAAFEDLETGGTVVVQPDMARAAYGTAVHGWLREFSTAATREGVDYLRVSTTDRLDVILRRYLVGRKGGG